MGIVMKPFKWERPEKNSKNLGIGRLLGGEIAYQLAISLDQSKKWGSPSQPIGFLMVRNKNIYNLF